MQAETRVEKRAMRDGISISDAMVAGLLGLHRYRLLTVHQVARLAVLKPSHIRDVLRRYERAGLLGSIGNVGLRGGSKAPKLYHLTRSGYAALCEAGGYEPGEIGPHVRAHGQTRWSPVLAHRVAVRDVLTVSEAGLAANEDYRLIARLHEYRRVKREGGQGSQPETSDFVGPERSSQNRIVPDAVFVLEKIATGGRGLYLVELDRGTERLARGTPEGYSVSDKFRLVERYLRGGRFARTYARFGEFRSFTLLFVSTTDARIENLRQTCAALDPQLHPYFRFSTLEAVMDDPFAPIWLSRDPDVLTRTSIIKLNKGEQQ